MHSIDLNADLGEFRSPEEKASEREVLNYVTSCNIACGGHAGDAETMRMTLMAAREAGVAAGAHPSYPDREGFGRRSMDIATQELKDSIVLQLETLKAVANELGLPLGHVKPHGALYNDAMDDTVLSGMVADCVLDVLPGAAMVGLPGAVFAKIADIKGVRFIAEAFVDRRYTAQGRLVPRKTQGAIIEDVEDRVVQAVRLTKEQTVIAQDGREIAITADTLCLHGDNEMAVETAKRVRRALDDAGIQVEAAAALK